MSTLPVPWLVAIRRLRVAAWALAAALAPEAALAHVYQFETASPPNGGAIPYLTSDSQCNGAQALSVPFGVDESFTATSAAVGLNITHARRGDVRARLVAPDGTLYTLFDNNTSDSNSNYDIFLVNVTDTGDDNVGNLNDGNDDPVAEPYYNRLVNGVTALNFGGGGKAAQGTWTLRLCDRRNNTNGTLNRVRLVLANDTPETPVCTSRVSYEWSNNGNGNRFTGATVGGISFSPTQEQTFGGPGIGNSYTTQTGSLGAHTGYYTLYMAPEDAGGTQAPETIGEHVSMSFSMPVQDLQFALTDIDWANNDFEDVIQVQGAAPTGAGFVPYARWAQTGSPTFEFAADVVEGDTTNADTSANGTANYFFDRALQSVSILYHTGNELNGSESNDQRIGVTDFSFCAFDFGDAPGSFGTTLASDGARHVLGSRQLWLGAGRPDGESEGAASANANGDDNAQIGGANDEDGVASFPTYTAGSSSYSVTVNATNNSGVGAFLVGYIDWNRDGDFADAGERSLTTSIPAGADASNFSVTWDSVPANAGGATATYSRFRLSTNQAAVESATGEAPDGEIEDYQIPAGTLPVSLAWLAVAPAGGGNLAVRWQTTTETANVGFRVFATAPNGSRRLLAQVPSRAFDSFSPRDYEVAVPARGVTAIELEDVSAVGLVRRHGPVAVGHSLGERSGAPAIDWAQVREEAGLASAGGGTPQSGRATTVARRAAVARDGLLLVSQPGIYRIGYEALLAAGIDLTGVPAGEIALLDDGKPMARYVAADPFGPGGFVEFEAEPRVNWSTPQDALELRVSREAAIAPTPFAAVGGLERTTAAEDRHRPDRRYSFGSPTADPWYDEAVLAWGAPGAIARDFDLPDLADRPVRLSLEGWGFTDWSGGAGPDHHVVVRLNGSEIAEDRFDGRTPWRRDVDVTGLAREAGNRLEVELPGDTGYAFDLFAFEGFTASYARATSARDGKFRGTATGRYAIGGFGPGEIVAWSGSGPKALRAAVSGGGEISIPAGLGEVVAAETSALLEPEVRAGIPAAVPYSDAEYVVVTHPAFAAGAEDLAQIERERGFDTEVVSVEAIASAHGDHVATPEALRRFLAASFARGHLRYVLLVGADTTDPWDHLGRGSVSFVPTAFVRTSDIVTYSPTDEWLVDFDGDGVAEVPIGRFPVRTAAELDAAVAKQIEWQRRERPRDVLLAAGASTEESPVSRINKLFADAMGGWQVGMASVDQIGADAVRSAVLSALSGPTPVVSFVGHSAPDRWDTAPVLAWTDVAGLTNAGAPDLVLQWGCWNSYAVDPEYESLSSHLLLAPEAGAAGTVGATTLTTDESHRRLGRLFYEQLAAGTPTVGAALRRAKRELVREGAATPDALLGVGILGDPALELWPAP